MIKKKFETFISTIVFQFKSYSFYHMHFLIILVEISVNRIRQQVCIFIKILVLSGKKQFTIILLNNKWSNEVKKLFPCKFLNKMFELKRLKKKNT